MREFYTEALVLNRENSGEFDKRITLYTKTFGKLTAKVKSARKITSKLSGHLEPLNFIKARIIERGGFQLVDALKAGNLALSLKSLRVLKLINGLSNRLEQDLSLWELIASGKANIKSVLKILGFDAKFAVCDHCGSAPELFSLSGLTFYCLACIGDNFSTDNFFPISE